MRQRAIFMTLTFIAIAMAVGIARPAAAHPLGNFTVNHYHGLHLYPDRVEDFAVIDAAEIPTLQEKATVDSDGNGTATPPELAAHAAVTCTSVAHALTAEVGERILAWQVTASAFIYRSGAANLPTSRTECHFTTTVNLRETTTLTIQDNFRADRVGWREMTVAGHDVAITDSPVPATSVSDELRGYPDDLLSSPLDQRSVRLRIAGSGPASGMQPTTAVPGAGPFARAMGALGNRLNALIAADRLTPLAGLVGILLALLLGAAHATLPGHGKTVIAAYLAGRSGTYRDAFTVGATVTATHTVGVLAVGLLLTTATSLAGEILLGWLGALSGLLIAAIGAGLLASALTKASRRRWPARNRVLAHSAASGAQADAWDHSTHSDAEADARDLIDDRVHLHQHHGHQHHGHQHHGHQHGHRHHRHVRPGAKGLLGMGIAGGLVPSPSALVVLLGAVALGRTWFGVLLVLAFGLGMAATLTAAGLLLVGAQRRLIRRFSDRLTGWTAWLAAVTPVVTAGLVLLVGVMLALRAGWPLVVGGSGG